MVTVEVVLPLTVRDLTAADLPSCAWSGGPMHIAAIAEALDRAGRGEVEYLAACPPSGLPVGLLAGRGFVGAQTHLFPGDRLFCYTDGCVEAENEQGDPFGVEALEQELVTAGPIGPAALLQHMEDALRTFRGAREPFDDATMLAVRVG